MKRVVPVAVEPGAYQVQRRHLFVGDFLSFGILAWIQFAADVSERIERTYELKYDLCADRVIAIRR